MNRNSLNILVGPCFFHPYYSARRWHTTGSYFDMAWLFAMTIVVVWLLVASKGLSRTQGMLLMLMYPAFLAVRVRLA